MKDIKYLNIPNICFSLVNANDNREEEYSKQRKTIGFDDSELWSLTDTICNFIIPRLKRFKEINCGCTIDLTEDAWNTILDDLIETFELISRDGGSRMFTNEERKFIEYGLGLFQKHFLNLWF